MTVTNMIQTRSLKVFRIALLVVILLSLKLMFVQHQSYDLSSPSASRNEFPSKKSAMNKFEGFNNETGGDVFFIPNIIHYIRFNKTEFSFVDYICIRSAYLHHHPDFIYFHTNVANFSGKYWDRMTNELELYERIRILRDIDLPMEIFGQKLSEGWRLFHGSDIARIRLLMKHGGIYLVWF